MYFRHPDYLFIGAYHWSVMANPLANVTCHALFYRQTAPALVTGHKQLSHISWTKALHWQTTRPLRSQSWQLKAHQVFTSDTKLYWKKLTCANSVTTWSLAGSWIIDESCVSGENSDKMYRPRPPILNMIWYKYVIYHAPWRVFHVNHGNKFNNHSKESQLKNPWRQGFEARNS